MQLRRIEILQDMLVLRARGAGLDLDILRRLQVRRDALHIRRVTLQPAPASPQSACRRAVAIGAGRC